VGTRASLEAVAIGYFQFLTLILLYLQMIMHVVDKNPSKADSL
jgi:hypothetical protein